jgi:hypothetical protein
LALYDAGGQLLATGVAGGQLFAVDNQICWIAPESGTYYLCVTSYTGAIVPYYELKLVEMPDGDYDALETAVAVSQRDGTRYELLNDQADEDWFAISVRPEARCVIGVVSFAPAALDCSLVDANGTPVSDGNQANGGVQFTVTGNGPVYLHVSQNGGDLGFYKLIVDYQALTNAFLPEGVSSSPVFTALIGTVFLRPEDYQLYCNQGLHFKLTITNRQGTTPALGSIMHGQGLDFAMVPLDAAGVAKLPALSTELIAHMTSNGLWSFWGLSVPPGDYNLVLILEPEDGPALFSYSTNFVLGNNGTAPSLVAVRNRNNRVVELQFDQTLHSDVDLHAYTSLLSADGQSTNLQAGDTVSIIGDYLSVRFAAGLPGNGVQIVIAAGALRSAGGAAASDLLTDPIQLVTVGDLVVDGRLDLLDLAELALRYGQKAPGDGYDLNLDGAVDLYDLVLLSKQFGASA